MILLKNRPLDKDEKSNFFLFLTQNRDSSFDYPKQMLLECAVVSVPSRISTPSKKFNDISPLGEILLVSCSTHHPLQFDMPHDHVWKNFDPQVPPLMHDPDDGMKITVWYKISLK